MCVYAFVYVCMYLRVCVAQFQLINSSRCCSVSALVGVSVSMYAHVCACVCMCMCMYVCMCVYVCVCACVCMCVYVCVCMCVMHYLSAISNHTTRTCVCCWHAHMLAVCSTLAKCALLWPYTGLARTVLYIGLAKTIYIR